MNKQSAKRCNEWQKRAENDSHKLEVTRRIRRKRKSKKYSYGKPAQDNKVLQSSVIKIPLSYVQYKPDKRWRDLHRIVDYQNEMSRSILNITQGDHKGFRVTEKNSWILG